MTRAQRRYVATEAVIGAAISAAMSIVFVLLMFDGARIALADLAVDALPQGFAIALMATLVPTWLTRRRMAKGTIVPLDGRMPLDVHIAARALLAAIVGAIVGAGLFALTSVFGVETIGFHAAIVAKAAWGALLGGAVAATMTGVALAERR